jgi:geranylgeranyl pyrophosphate synthase
MNLSEIDEKPFVEFWDNHKESIYKKILENLPNNLPEEFDTMVNEYVHRRGKYGRPTIILLWAKLHGANIEDALMPAATMQLSEDWILVHDDIEDSNEFRRGKPAAHMLYGIPQTINAADYLHILDWKMAFKTRKILEETLDKEIADLYLDRFFHMILKTSEGQYIDMKLTSSKDITNFTLEDYFKSIQAKAGYYSVYGPMMLGAIIAGKDKTYIEKIEKYGIAIGNAFQLKDDILDCTSTKEELGKTIGNDVLEGVKTPILLHTVKNASEEDLETLKTIYAKDRKDKTQKDIQIALNLFAKYDAYTYAKKLVDDLAQKAIDNFEEETKSLPENEVKQLARGAIKKMVVRKK